MQPRLPGLLRRVGTGHQADGFSLSLEQVEAMLDAFVAAEGRPEAVQLSGGEPSIHPQILEMLAAAKARGISLVMLNTNGIRLARDPRFAPALAGLGVHVYLQFDGFDDATHLAIRGRRLQAIKLAALDRCAAAGVGVSLAAAVERGSTSMSSARSCASASSIRRSTACSSSPSRIPGGTRRSTRSTG